MFKVIDLFAGCGGLSLGFRKVGFESAAAIEWDAACIATLQENFPEMSNTILHRDIQKTHCVFRELENQLNGELMEIDGIIGGPPCQAYSLAGRIRCPSGMKNDYRNFLFESYIAFLKQYKPKFFVFENVVGMLSARPGDVSVVDRMSHAFAEAGYLIPEISREITFDLADIGGPQRRKRVIIFGVLADSDNANAKIKRFYDNLRNAKRSPMTVRQCIGDLRPLYPSSKPEKRQSHSADPHDLLHRSRFHNERDIGIFRLLAADARKANPKYKDIEALKRLYTEKTGKSANVHKYYVLDPESTSNLIPAHLYKDGLRHIHYDPAQARSITMREAARLQTFPDSFKFKGSQTDIFKMIGNAVPPMLAEAVARSVLRAFENDKAGF